MLEVWITPATAGSKDWLKLLKVTPPSVHDWVARWMEMVDES